MNTNKIEVVLNDKSYFVDAEEAERELGIARGDRKEITTEYLVTEEDSGEKMPLFVRPHQTLVIKASGGKLSCPGWAGSGCWLEAKVINDGAEAHFKSRRRSQHSQESAEAWVDLTDSGGQRRKLTFTLVLTKN